MDITDTSSPATSRTTSEAPHDTPLTKKKVAFAFVAGLLVVAALSIGMWGWVNGTPWTGEQKATAHLDVVKVSASLVVMLGGLGALYLTMLRQRTQDKQLAHAKEELAHARDIAAATDKDAAARRVTELYAKSVEQLGSDKGPVRLGGLYALERLAQDNSDQRQTVVNVLCAYLRMAYSIPDDSVLNTLENQHADAGIEAEQAGHDGALPESSELIEERQRYQLQQQEHEVRLAAFRILTSHLRPDRDTETGNPSNLRFWGGERLHLDLTGAQLADADFSACEFDVAVFERATFHGSTSFKAARFQLDASFRRAKFFGRANFDGAKFRDGALFANAEFRDIADFTKVEIKRANFREARFARTANFEDVTFLRPAAFIETTFQANALFFRTRFGVADFERAEFMSAAAFLSTRFTRTLFSGARFHADVNFTAGGQCEHVDLSGATAAAPQQDKDAPSRVWPAGWELGPAVPDGVWDDELWSPIVRITSGHLTSGMPSQDATAES